MAEIKFYSDSAKENQVYPEIDPNGYKPGMTVGLAENLISPVEVTSHDTFLIRPTGGGVSVSNGMGYLKRLYGNIRYDGVNEALSFGTLTSDTYSTSDLEIHIFDQNEFKNLANTDIGSTETYSFKAQYDIDITDNSHLITAFNRNDFINYALNSTLEYCTITLTYDPASQNVSGDWHFVMIDASGTSTEEWQSSPSWYGFTVIDTGLVQDDSFTVICHYVEYAKNLTKSESYYKSDWGDWGLEVLNTSDDTPVDFKELSDEFEFTMLYTAGTAGGDIYFAKPTKLTSVGFNLYNKNNNNTNFEGYYINPATNKLITMPSPVPTLYDDYYCKGVICFRCVKDQTFTIYNYQNKAVFGMAFYSQTIPTTSTTFEPLIRVDVATSGQLVRNGNNKTYITTSKNGYLSIPVYDVLEGTFASAVEGMCCHLTWSGYKDERYEPYWENSIVFNKEFRSDTVYGPLTGVFTDGLKKPINSLNPTIVDEQKEYIAYDTYSINISGTKTAYSSSAWNTIQSNLSDYTCALYGNLDGDSTKKYIYSWKIDYTDTTLYNLEGYWPIQDHPSYRVDDFGIEYFEGVNVPVEVVMSYTSNLRDKLSNDVEIKANKTTVINSTSTNIEYPTAKAVYDSLSLKADESTVEKTSNKVTAISNSSTNTQYPSAKVVYDQLYDGTSNLSVNALTLGSDSTTSKLKYGAAGREDYTSVGFTYDGNGNMKQKSGATSSNYWYMADKSGNRNLKVYPETGQVDITGSLIENNHTVYGFQTGSWTPVVDVRDTGNAPSVTYTSRRGTYIKIGKLVYINFYIKGQITSLNSNPTSYGCISGLPFETKSCALGELALSTGVAYNHNPSYQNGTTFCPYGWVIYLQGLDGSWAQSWQVTSSGSGYFELGANGFYEAK